MSNKNQLYYALALTKVDGIGDANIRKIIYKTKDFAKAFELSIEELQEIELGPAKIQALKNFDNWADVDREMKDMENHGIEAVTLVDKEFPQRLSLQDYAPSLLYYKGNIDFNVPKMLSIVGTRTNTKYGKESLEKLLDDLKVHQPTIVSGLAYGIDIIAHRKAMEIGLPTIAVMATGLDTIYPPEHLRYIKDICSTGGIVSTNRIGTTLHPSYFPVRNRIIALLCDALIIIESGDKGGSMITANLANDFNRDVFALPGKITDTKSKGCNTLIKINKANLLQSAKDIEYLMGWDVSKKVNKIIQPNLFIELTEDEDKIISVLKLEGSVHADVIAQASGFPISKSNALLVTLELKGVIRSLPGNIHELIM